MADVIQLISPLLEKVRPWQAIIRSSSLLTHVKKEFQKQNLSRRKRTFSTVDFSSKERASNPPLCLSPWLDDASKVFVSTVTICNSPDLIVSLTVRLFNSSPNDVANQRAHCALDKKAFNVLDFFATL